MKMFVYLAIGAFIGQNFVEARTSYESKNFGFMALDIGYIVLGLISFAVVVVV